MINQDESAIKKIREAAATPIFSSMAVILFLAFFHLFLFKPYYLTNDDIFKVFYAQGVGSELVPTDFIGYSNPLWGFLLKSLFTAFPNIPWYGILMTFIQYLSLGAILYALRLGENGLFKTFLFITSFFFVYCIFFHEIQFTVTSSLAAQAALFLVVALWQSRESSPRSAGWWAAGFLLFISSLIRLESLFMTFLCALPFLLHSWSKESGPSRRSLLISRRFFLISVFSLVAGGALYNFLWYQKDAGWREFKRFDHERVELQDYRIDPYEGKNEPFYRAAGWTSNDFVLFKSWYFMDEDVYDVEKMRELKRHFPRIGSKGKPSSYESLPELLSSPGALILLMYFLAFALFASPAGLRLLLLQFAWILAVLTLMIYFLRAPERVFLPLFALAIGASMFLAVPPLAALRRFDLGEGRWIQWAGTLFLILCLISGGRLYSNQYANNLVAVEREKLLVKDLQRLDPKDDDLYVIWDSSFPYEAINAFDSLEFFRKFHLLVLAVYQRSPLAKKTMERFGVRRPFRDLVDNPRVHLICTPTEGKVYGVYMWEKFKMDIYPEKTFDSTLFQVFQIHSRPPEKTHEKKGKARKEKPILKFGKKAVDPGP